MPADLALLIRDLSDRDVTTRERAGMAIFRLGCELAGAAVQTWLRDPQLAALWLRDHTGAPELTAGIAVRPDTFERIRAACGSPPLAHVPPDQDACEFELHFPGGARLDVLTTSSPTGGGAIARFLGKSGEGIQQVEVGVSDVEHATDLVREKFGVSPVYPATRAGANGTRVNFFLVPAAENRKVLIELVEGPRHSMEETPD